MEAKKLELIRQIDQENEKKLEEFKVKNDQDIAMKTDEIKAKFEQQRKDAEEEEGKQPHEVYYIFLQTITFISNSLIHNLSSFLLGKIQEIEKAEADEIAKMETKMKKEFDKFKKKLQ